MNSKAGRGGARSERGGMFFAWRELGEKESGGGGGVGVNTHNEVAGLAHFPPDEGAPQLLCVADNLFFYECRRKTAALEKEERPYFSTGQEAKVERRSCITLRYDADDCNCK